MSRARRRAPAVALIVGPLLVAAALGPGPAAAQEWARAGDGSSPDAAPAWLGSWSPLGPVGTLPRALPSAGDLRPELLLLPAAPVGLFWTAGNPAGLVDEQLPHRVTFAAGVGRREGDYRRPLDPGAVEHRGGSGVAWGPLGGSGAGLGRVVVERVAREAPASGDALLPDATSPLAVLDTLGDARTATVARLEAAGSWRLGRLTLGLAPAYRAERAQTEVAAVSVDTRTAVPAVRAGAAYRLPSGLRLGVEGGWQREVHSVTAWAVRGAATIYELTGYAEPVPILISQEGGALYTGRFEREAAGAGVSVAGEASGTRWTAFARLERESNRRFAPGSATPLTDRWEANGWQAGAAATRSLGERVRVAADLRVATTSGELSTPTFEEPVFVTDESRLRLEGEVRAEAGAGWTLGGRILVVREDLLRRDRAVRARHELDAWSSGLVAEAATRLGAGVSLAVAAGGLRYGPTGTIPFPDRMNSVYQKWVAPGALVEGSPATAWTTGATLRWESRPGTAFWLRAGYEALTPTGGGRVHVLRPDGRRTGFALRLGAQITDAR